MGGYIGARSGTISATVANVQDVTATDTTPEITLKNTTETDADGSRGGKITFKGEQSGGEESTLANIQASHDGSSDDEKGDLIFRTNDGSDGASPTERVRIDSNGSILTATLGTDNVHLGEGAAASIASGGNLNTLIGKDAGTAITTGTDNTFVGSNAGDALVDSDHNVAVGHQALTADTKGSKSTAVGAFSLNAQNFTGATDALNTAVGYVAGSSITTGAENTIMGGEAGDALTVGNGNVAIGVQALTTDVNGSRSTAVGTTALKIQEASGSTSNNYYNVGFGYGAGHDLTTGYYNTCIGSQSADVLATGNQNIYLGYDSTASSSSVSGEIAIGYSVTGFGTGYIGIGNNNNGRIYNQFTANATWTHTSDERMKKDIQTNTDCGLDFINDLRTVTYKWKAPSEHPEEFVSYNADKTEAAHTEKMYGFIAQEVKAAMDTHNITDFAGWDCLEEQGGQQGISYEMFVMPLVKAVQELSAKVTTLETKVAALEAE